MRAYDKAPDEVHDRAQRLIEDYYPDLHKAEVTLDILFAVNENGDAVSHGGYPALAMIRIVNLKDRVKGLSDAEITIDKEAYDDMSDEQKDALLDHELHHLIVLKDDDGFIKTDDCNRPKLKIKKHDYQMGWFREIAVRHGRNSPEVYQAKILFERDGQAFFPMLIGDKEAA